MTILDGDTIETMAAWIDRQPWPDHVKVEAHSFGDNSSMSRVLWQEWIDNNHNGLTLADRDGGKAVTTLATIYYTADIYTPDDTDTTIDGEATEPGTGQTLEQGWYDESWDAWGVFKTRDEVRPDTIESDDERFSDGYTLDEIVVQVIEETLGAIDSFDGDTAYASDSRINYTTGVHVMLAAHVTIEPIDTKIDTKFLDMAAERFAWPGGYEIFFVTDDGGVLCSPCVVENWDEVIATADPGDGWFIEGYGHDGELDEAVHCDHCYREIGGDGEDHDDTTLDNHTHKFAATWERSRIAGTPNRPCTFPGCRVVTLDGADDDHDEDPDTTTEDLGDSHYVGSVKVATGEQFDKRDIPEGTGMTPNDYAAIAAEERATAKLGLEVGCYSEESRGIYSIVRLYELVGDLLEQRDMPKDQEYLAGIDYDDAGRIIQHSMFGDQGANITLASGESISLDDAHEYSSALYDELTDLLPTPPGLTWIWNDGGLYLWDMSDIDENGELI